MLARTARSRKLKNSEKERRNKARCKCGPRWRVEKERKRTFEERERELKREGSKRKTLERGENDSRSCSGILEIFKESAGVPVRASPRPLPRLALLLLHFARYFVQS